MADSVFEQDVLMGLSAQPKFLSSKYFYDKTGDALFVKIMDLPEYYLTRAEMEIFAGKTQELINAFKTDKNTPFQIIELGAGDGSKTKKLLQKLVEGSFDFSYVPVDISGNTLELLQDSLLQELPGLHVRPQQGDYFDVLEKLKQTQAKKVVLFVGSSIGNMVDDKAADFITKLSNELLPGDVFLLGVDIIKPAEVVLPAYNDNQGITSAFNLNLLTRINREMDANFDVNQFEHVPQYTEEEGIAKSYLRSKTEQSVHITSLGKTFHFAKNETIHTEISRKYNDAIIEKIFAKTDLHLIEKITDDAGLFADYIFERR